MTDAELRKMFDDGKRPDDARPIGFLLLICLLTWLANFALFITMPGWLTVAAFGLAAFAVACATGNYLFLRGIDNDHHSQTHSGTRCDS